LSGGADSIVTYQNGTTDPSDALVVAAAALHHRVVAFAVLPQG